MGNIAGPIACAAGGAALGGQLGILGGDTAGRILGERAWSLCGGSMERWGSILPYVTVCKTCSVLGGGTCVAAAGGAAGFAAGKAIYPENPA